jgi:multidrug transporter EmrE-like cation transporter
VTHVSIFLSILLGACAQIFMKLGARHANDYVHLFLNWQVIVGIFMYGLSAIFWIATLSRVQLSYAYPMVSLGYVIVFVASYFIFGDNLNAWRISGLVFIILGVVLISRS